MNKGLMKLAAICGLSLLTITAQAYPVLPNLSNLNFLQYNGTAPRDTFQNVNPVGWTGGNGLIYVDQPGNSSNSNSACGGTNFPSAQCPSTLNIQGGYNYIQADGNPSYESGFQYLVTGLTVGQTYTLSFYQAASQQLNFADYYYPNLNTTEQWIVSLGTQGLSFCFGCGAADAYYGGIDSTYSNADTNASVVATNLMTTPPGGLVDWQYVTVNLKADSTSDILSFLAWGDNGNTINTPPIVFLAGVNTPGGLVHVPEPATLALMGIGLLGLGAGSLRRSNKA